MAIVDRILDAVAFVPWWAWFVMAVATVPAALFAAATALGLASATGANHHALTRRQRRMGRLGYVAALLAVPASVVVGLLALAAMLWALLG